MKINYELKITNYENTIIDISHLPVGIYFVKICDKVKSFIISK